MSLKRLAWIALASLSLALVLVGVAFASGVGPCGGPGLPFLFGAVLFAIVAGILLILLVALLFTRHLRDGHASGQN